MLPPKCKCGQDLSFIQEELDKAMRELSSRKTTTSQQLTAESGRLIRAYKLYWCCNKELMGYVNLVDITT